jgi:tetratricopeptide (TPR) repeat protein
VATALAGLASSEMTRAQYRRSLAAQQQSKAGDQWSLFQAKRVRRTSQRTTLDILEVTTDVHPLDAAALRKVHPALESPPGEQTLAALQGGHLPVIPAGPALDPRVVAALEAVENSKPEGEIIAMLAQISDKALDDALGIARDRAQALDVALRPGNRTIDELEARLVRQSAADGSGSGPTATLRRDVTVARLPYTARRYDAEARLNQAIANAVPNYDLARLTHRVAASYLAEGMDQPAFDVAVSFQAPERRAVPLLDWDAGLAAFRLGNYADAASRFELVAQAMNVSNYQRAAGAFWAARAYLRFGDPQRVITLLNAAARLEPRTQRPYPVAAPGSCLFLDTCAGRVNSAVAGSSPTLEARRDAMRIKCHASDGRSTRSNRMLCEGPVDSFGEGQHDECSRG